MAEKGSQCYCESCRRTMDAGQFYTSNNIEKYPPDGKLTLCKKCLTLCVDNWDPNTFKPILQEIDVPYVKEEWDKLLTRYSQKKSPEEMSGMTILGRYLAKMKLKQWKDYRWADSEKIQAEIDARKAQAMRATGANEEQIAERIKEDTEFQVPMPEGIRLVSQDQQPQANSKKTQQLTQPAIEQYEEEDFESTLDLTDEDRTYLRLKWGRNYTLEEWVTMEQLYNDMCESYDIQTAGHKDTLKLICKTSLKANQCIDQGDLDGYKKLSSTYDALMKSGKFTAAQNKNEAGEFVDSIGELVAICEKQGFIPRFYVDGPQDKVDRTLQDLQGYTKALIEDELGLGDKIESAAKQLMEARINEYHIDDDNDVDPDSAFEETLFSDNAERVIADEDFQRLREQEDEDAEADAEYINSLLERAEKEE